MDYWLINFLACIVISGAVCGIIMPNIMNIAFKRNLYDEVDERKVHKGVVPRLGGVAFLPAILFSFCAVMGYGLRADGSAMQEVAIMELVPIFFLVCALMLMYVVGLSDDMVGVRYRLKFLFQIIAGVLIILSGCWVRDLHGFIGLNEWPDAAGWILSVLLVIYIVNSMNLIDGIDGLASGLSAIALGFYSWVFYNSGQYGYALLSGATLGALIPFIYYNVFGKAERRTKIFMGDTGSLTVGTILAFLSIEMFNVPTVQMIGGENQFVMALTPVMLPCLDSFRVFFHRVRMGHNPFLPDRCHIHHKFLALGFKQWQALLIILGLDLIIIAFNMAFSTSITAAWIIIWDLTIWVVINYLLTKIIKSREEKVGETFYT